MASLRAKLGVRFVIAALLAGVSVVSYLSKRSTNELTGETQFVKLSQDEEISLGLASAPQMTRQFGGKTQNERISRYVAAVGERLVQKSAAAKTSYQFSFTVLGDRKTVNAFALPGGPIFITEALLDRLDNEAQLAGVLGHEIGHVVGRHGAERLAKASLTQGLVGATVVATSDPNNPGHSRAKAALAAATAQVISMRFGREDELESDRLGVRFMHEAGYDARQLVDVMRVLKASGGGRTPEFFSTHPDPENRIERIEAAIAQLPSAEGMTNEEAFRQHVRQGYPEASAPTADFNEGPGVRARIRVAELPDEGQQTLSLIEANGPFAFERDGIEFANREGRLPAQPSGYYREYTVPTPGERTRGARRIVTGRNGERYYTDNHYRTFSLIVP